MADIAFARQFLQSLSTRHAKLSPTHVEDPKSYPARGAHILPHSNLKPLPKRTRAAPSNDKLNITLTSARNPPLSIATAQPATISVLELKNIVAEEASIPVTKIKVLYNKKPVHDAKTLGELLGEGWEGQNVELGLMIMGGATSIVPREAKETPSPPVTSGTPEVQMRDAAPVSQNTGREGEEEVLPSTAVGPHGRELLGTKEFWDDLHGFLAIRLKDEGVAREVLSRFEASWKGQN